MLPFKKQIARSGSIFFSTNFESTFEIVQVNLFQKPSFLHQLTHNMSRDCSLNSKKNASSQHVVYKYCFECQNKNKNNFCTQHVVNLYFFGEFNENLLSYCGLTDARMRASEKDLPVKVNRIQIYK